MGNITDWKSAVALGRTFFQQNDSISDLVFVEIWLIAEIDCLNVARTLGLMNEQAQIAAVFLAGMFAGTEPGSDRDLAGAAPLMPRPKPAITEISSGSCQIVERHVPREDVAFQPGVSINGAPVTPASVSSNWGSGYSPVLQPVYEFNVRIDPLPGAPNIAPTRMTVATVAYDPESGRVTVNGEELVWLHEAALRSACESRVTITP